MQYQYILAHYSNDNNIKLYARDENYNKHCFTVTGFEPFFYVDDNVYVPDVLTLKRIEKNFINHNREPLKKLIMQKPTDVGGNRLTKQQGFREMFPKHYEADIDFIRNFLRCNNITSGFTLETPQKTLHYTQLTPTDFTLSPYTVFLDIEVYTKTRFPDPLKAEQPIVCITFYDTVHKKYLTIILDEQSQTEKHEDWIIIHVTTEQELIKLIDNYLNYLFDVSAGWNFKFDEKYIFNRARKLNIPMKSLLQRGTCSFDLLEANAMITKPLGNDLANVLTNETIENNGQELSIAEKVNYEPWTPELWEKPELRQKAVKINRSHVEGLIELDKKYNIIQQFWGYKNIAGMEDMMSTLHHGTLIDTVALRWYRQNNIVLPSKPVGMTYESFQGATVFEPKEGIYENIAVFDMSRYYLNIVIGYNITFEKVDQNQKGIFPQICEWILSKREEYETLLKQLTPGTEQYKSMKLKRNSIKYLGETVWGYLASTGRCSDREKAKQIPAKARKGLESLRAYVENTLHYKVIYGDTDSTLIKCTYEQALELETQLNTYLEQYSKQENITVNLKLKLDKYCQKALFSRTKTQEKGAKKRYALHVINENHKPCDYIDITGYETVRKDSSKLTKKVLNQIFKYILKEGTQQLATYIQTTIKDMKNMKYSFDYISIPRTIKQPIEQYKTDSPWLRGLKWSNKYLQTDIRSGDYVRLIYGYIKGYPHTDCFCFLQSSQLDQVKDKIVVNWTKMIETTIRKKIENIISLCNISWEQCNGARKIFEEY